MRNHCQLSVLAAIILGTAACADRPGRTAAPVPPPVEEPSAAPITIFEFEIESTRMGYAPRAAAEWVVAKDDRHAAAILERDAQWLVVIDGQEGPEFDGIARNSLVFSPDGTRVAYVAITGDKRQAVIDGNSGHPYDGIGPLFFSPDSNRLAYGARKGTKSVVVTDGIEGPEYDNVLAGIVHFSPDSQRVAYVAQDNEKWMAVIDGVAQRQWDAVGQREHG